MTTTMIRLLDTLKGLCEALSKIAAFYVRGDY